MKMYVFLMGGLLLAATAPQATLIPNRAQESLDGRFGLVLQDESGVERLLPGRVVPRRSGVAYGWEIQLPLASQARQLREEFELPQAPKTWGTGEFSGLYRISVDRRIAVTERPISSGQRLLKNTWLVAPGDPRGPYVIRVFVDDVLVQTFEFVVE